MPLPESMLPLVVIIGPTAVGKTEIALNLAERLGAEIVSADSRLFYRGMDIGTAKPSPLEMKRVPHHLIDVADPDQIWSLAIYQREAAQAIAAIHARGRLPMLVGGTGQYIRAVIEGWQPPDQQPDQALRTALEAWGAEIGRFELHRRLGVIDPQMAAVIDPHNMRRTVRALEVIFSTGTRFSEQRLKKTSPYRLLQVGLSRPRPELYERIDTRIDQMMQNGFVGEVHDLLSRGYAPELPTLSAIGYGEIIAYLQGRYTQEEAVMHIKRSTREFVRRQANWFKENDPEIHWFQVNPDTTDAVEALIRAWQMQINGPA